jgi:hypothetical protein
MAIGLSTRSHQVPVIQKQDGNVFMEGNLNTLCPAYRFVLIVNALERGAIAALPANVRSGDTRGALLAWLKSCHQAIGDPVTMQISGEVHEAFQMDENLQKMSIASQSLIDLSWAGREDFYEAPNEYVLDAGLFAEHYPCQPRYVRTRDGKLAFLGDLRNSQAEYVAAHAIPVLQSAVFGDQWDSNWAKMPEISIEERADLIHSSWLYYKSLGREASVGTIPTPLKIVIGL